MSTITPSTETTDDSFFRGRWLSELPTKGNTPVDLTRGFLEFARTRVMRKGMDAYSPRFAAGLDSAHTISKLELEYRSSVARGEQEHLGEDSLKSAPGGVPLSVVGRAKEHGPRRGEHCGDMNDEAPSKVATHLASEHRYPSVFALSVVFGGGIGQTAFSMLGLSAGGGFLVGFTLVFLPLASAVLISRARSESPSEEAHQSKKPN